MLYWFQNSKILGTHQYTWQLCYSFYFIACRVHLFLNPVSVHYQNDKEAQKSAACCNSKSSKSYFLECLTPPIVMEAGLHSMNMLSTIHELAIEIKIKPRMATKNLPNLCGMHLQQFTLHAIINMISWCWLCT